MESKMNDKNYRKHMDKKTENLERYVKFRKKVLAGEIEISNITSDDMIRIDNLVIDILSRGEDLY